MARKRRYKKYRRWRRKKALLREIRFERLETALTVVFPNRNPQETLQWDLGAQGYSHAITLSYALGASERWLVFENSVGQFKIQAVNIKIMPQNYVDIAQTTHGPCVLAYYPGLIDGLPDQYGRVITANYCVHFTGRETSVVKKYINLKYLTRWQYMYDTTIQGAHADAATGGLIITSSFADNSQTGGKWTIVINLYVMGKGRVI